MSYKMDAPDAVKNATATELENLHAKFHESYDSPSSDIVIESHHWITQGLNKMGIRLPSEPDWEAAIVSSQWQMDVTGIDLIEMGLTQDPKVADLAEKSKNFVLSELVTFKSRDLIIKPITDQYSLIKQVEERRFTLGPMYIPDRLDAHGEWTDANELQQAVWDYVKSGDRRIRLQHNRDVVAGEWVEVMTFPYPLTVPMSNADGSSEEVTYPANTVFLGVQWDDWAWEMVKSGKLRGYSIGGKASRLEADIPQEEEKSDGPTVSDVHVDTIMGQPRRRKK